MMRTKTIARRLATFAGIVTTSILGFPGTALAAFDANWEMNDLGSPPPTMVDSSGGHDGQPTGGIVGNGRTYGFDGTGVVIVHDPDGTTLNPGSQNITITASVAFRQLPPGRDYDILRKKPTGVKDMQYRMEIMATGKAKCFFTGDTGNAAITGRPVLNDGQFHIITCTKTASAIGITVDGQAKTKSVLIGSIVNATNISIGAKLEGGDDFVGRMRYVKLNYA